MQFDHVIGGNARVLVQVVDILGDNARNLAGLVQCSKSPVAAARLGRRKHRRHRKPALPGLVPRLLARHELVVGDRPVAGPDAARRAEVGDAAFGGDPGAGEGDDAETSGKQLPQSLDALAQIRLLVNSAHAWSPLMSRFRSSAACPASPERTESWDTSRFKITVGFRFRSSP